MAQHRSLVLAQRPSAPSLQPSVPSVFSVAALPWARRAFLRSRVGDAPAQRIALPWARRALDETPGGVERSSTAHAASGGAQPSLWLPYRGRGERSFAWRSIARSSRRSASGGAQPCFSELLSRRKALIQRGMYHCSSHTHTVRTQ